MQLVGEALGRLVFLAAGARHRLLPLVEAGGKRARHAPLEDQQMRHLDRKDLVAVELAIGLERRHRAQQRRPLVIVERAAHVLQDRKSTRLNSSHTVISYAVFCLKKKKNSSPHW